ncbi:hypothetical protein [Aliihoeflea sp. PC F10.4]
MRSTMSLFAGLLVLAVPVWAQDDAPIEFAGTTFTITEADDLQKILTADGEEIARDYVIFHDRNVTLGDIEVAIFQKGPGGNMCGSVSVMVWRDGAGDLQAASPPDECGAPSPAVTQDAIFFVPYLMPGAQAVVRRWSPDEGMRTHGSIAYVPEPDTGWDDFDPAAMSYPTDVFRNAAIYEMALATLGDNLSNVTTALLVSAGLEPLGDSGIYTANGCVPHACGASDGFMAIDTANRRLYFAQQHARTAWPPLDDWPENIRAAKDEAIGAE